MENKITKSEYASTNETLANFFVVQRDQSQRISNFQNLYRLFNGDAIKEALNTAEYAYIYNQMALTICDYTTLETSAFEIQLPPHDNTDEGKQESDIIEKFLFSVWERNHQLLRVYDMMFFKNLYGEAPLHVFPHKDFGIRIMVADPRECFPVMEEGTDNIFEMYMLQKRTNKQLRRWNQDKFPNDYVKRDVLFYWNAEKYEVMTKEGEVIWDSNHGLGRAPWVLARNPYYPGEVGGFSSMEWTAGLCKYLNQLMSDLATIVHYNSAPIIIGEGTGIRDRNQWLSGPNVFNPVNKGARVYPLVIGEPAMLSNQIKRVTEQHDEASGLPGLMHGETEDSAVSEKAIRAKSVGAELRVQLRRNLVSPALATVNSFILQQTEKFFPDSITFYSSKSSTGILTLDPKTIKNNYLTAIQFPIGLLDYASKVVTILQLVNSKLMSKLHAMDLLQIRSPRDEAAQIKVEAMEELEHELTLKQAATAPQVAAPEVAAPAATGGRPPGPPEGMMPGEAEAMERERMERGSPRTQSRPPGRPGEPTPRPNEVARSLEEGVPTPQERGRLVLNEVVRALATIEKIRGRIFIFGELAIQGWTEGQIDLMLTDMIDKQTILNGLPMWRGRFNFVRVPATGQPEGEFITVPRPGEPESPMEAV